MDKNRGWKPTAAERRKMVRGTIRCAYIYKDGLVLIEDKPITLFGQETMRVEVEHIYPVHIPILARDWRQSVEDRDAAYPKVNRIVVHDPTILAYGVSRVDVSFGGSSDAMKERSITYTGVYIETPDQVCVRHVELNGLLAGGFTVQPNPYNSGYAGDDSIRNWVDHRNSVVHGELEPDRAED